MAFTTRAAVVHQARRDVEGGLRLDRAGDVAGEHDALADALDPDVGIRQRLPDRGAQPVEVARHRDIETDDLLAVVVEEEHVGLSAGRADDVGAARRADHGVGDLRIGDQHVLDVARQVDDHRLADAERDETRAGVARRHGDDLLALIGCGRAAGSGQPERNTQGNKHRGADQRHFSHVSPLVLPLFRRRGRGDAETNDVDAVALATIVAGVGLVALRIDQAAQRQR